MRLGRQLLCTLRTDRKDSGCKDRLWAALGRLKGKSQFNYKGSHDSPGSASSKLLTSRSVTPGERISSGSWWTAAQWIVIDHSTIGSDSASSRARVVALVLVAGSVLRTLRINDALGPAIRGRTDERVSARAHCLVLDSSAQTVRSAR